MICDIGRRLLGILPVETSARRDEVGPGYRSVGVGLPY